VGSRVELNRTDLNRAKHRGGKSDIHNSREKFPRKARLGVSSFISTNKLGVVARAYQLHGGHR
jgi:hypothetical protein